MTLLKEIQQGAINAEVDISTVLRKCLVFATRLKHEGLKKWAESELNGYAAEEDLPSYRIISETPVHGNFVGPYGSQLKNGPIPPSAIPQEHRERLFSARLTEPISVYTHITAVGGNKTIYCEWPAEAIVHFGATIYANMSCISASQQITTSLLHGVVEAVRNRVLSFSLEIEAAVPDAAHVASPEAVLSNRQISQLFQTYIMGDVSNWSAGGSNIQQISTINVGSGDLDTLLTAVRELGAGEEEVEELRKAVESPEVPTAKGKFGPRVAKWMGRAITKAAEGAYKVGTEVAADVLAKALNGYYGLS